jgi:hypothetical protein
LLVFRLLQSRGGMSIVAHIVSISSWTNIRSCCESSCTKINNVFEFSGIKNNDKLTLFPRQPRNLKEPEYQENAFYFYWPNSRTLYFA